ncbi:MAG: glycosyltransferase family 2 protein [Chloroflexota bacterium]|nr:glycosyltransferase family 2 protein [Chloroflexota bacterium]
MRQLTAIVLTYNEAEQIGACVDALRFADRILIFDSYSSDDTVSIARRSGADVLQRSFVNYADQRNAALDAVEGESEWVLFVDADERISADLAAEIRRKLSHSEFAAWQLPRHNYIFGKLTRGAGWYPDYQTRLLRLGQARYDPQRQVHEVVMLNGPIGTMDNPIIHYNYQNVAHFMDKQERYLRFEARMLFDKGAVPKFRNFILQPLRQFHLRYVTLKGYRDHWHGLRLSLFMAWYEYRKYRRLAELHSSEKP